MIVTIAFCVLLWVAFGCLSGTADIKKFRRDPKIAKGIAQYPWIYVLFSVTLGPALMVIGWIIGFARALLRDK